jgi:hypothetical protein
MRALFWTVVARIRNFLHPAALDADFEQELELLISNRSWNFISRWPRRTSSGAG